MVWERNKLPLAVSWIILELYFIIEQAFRKLERESLCRKDFLFLKVFIIKEEIIIYRGILPLDYL